MPTHINTPFLPEERAALEALARREARSLGQQIRILAVARLQEMNLLPAGASRPAPAAHPQEGHS